MSILISLIGPFRAICMAIDNVAFGLLDNAYNIVVSLSSATILEHDAIEKMMRNLYILFGVVAFFRLALVLVNSIIDPEKLNEKGKGTSNIFFRVVGMIIILAITPFLFEESYNIQKKIVSSDANENVIFSLILGDRANIGGYDKDGYNAGKALQNVVLSSLVTIDDRYLVNNGAVCSINDKGEYVNSDGNVVGDYKSECGFIPLTCVPKSYEADGKTVKTCQMQGGYIYDGSDGKCDWKNCHNAVAKYNQMYVDEDMNPLSLAGSVGVSGKIEDEDGNKEEVYVYDYMLVVTSIAGIAMTWIILSFAIDIAVRMFELIVLEVLAPLFIATFVDPKSAQSGPFKNWLSAVGRSYASLYIRLAILALMTLLIMVVNQSEIFNNMRGEISGFAKIFVIFGLLIFAKKAPKWISDMIGIKSDGMGLWSPSKMKDAMIGGALAAKAGRGALAAGSGLLRGAGNHLRNKKAQRDDIADKKLGDKKARRENRQNAFRKGNVGGWLSEMNNQRKDRQAAIKTAKASGEYKGIFSKEAWGQGIISMGNGVGSGFTAGIKADNIKGALSSGKEAADNFKSSVGMDGSTLSERMKSAANRTGSKLVNAAFGDEGERYERADKLEKAKSRKQNHTAAALSKYGDALYDGMGSFSSLEASNGKARNISDKKAIYGAILSGVDKANIVYDGDTLKINGKTDISDYINKAQDSLSGAGKVDFLNKFNKEQTNTVSEYANNRQAITDITQAMNSTKKLIENSTKAMKDAFSNIEFNSLSARIALDTSTGRLKIDGNDFNLDFDTLTKKISELKKTGNTEDLELARLLEDKSLLDAMEQNKTYTSILNSQESEAVNLQKRNDALYVQVLGVQDKYNKDTGLVKINKETGQIDKDPGALTIAGAQDILARDKESIGKMVEASKKKLEKEGKD